MYHTKINDREIVLLDTPGFDGSGTENFELLHDIFSILYFLALQKSRFPIHGIVFLHDISEVRFSRSQRKTLSTLRALCGERCMGNVIVGTMRWSPQGSAKFKKEEERERAFLSEHWGGVYQTTYKRQFRSFPISWTNLQFFFLPKRRFSRLLIWSRKRRRVNY